MDAELSIPINVPPLSDHVRGTDRVSPAMAKREGRPGKGRPFDLGASEQEEGELSPSSRRAADRRKRGRREDSGAPEDGRAPAEASADGGRDARLDYQA